jgi:hypothetical protein
MRTVDAPARSAGHVKAVWGVFGAAALVLVAALVLRRGDPPQMGGDREVFRAVDALYTAVTAREPRLVDRCEADLTVLKESGKLPADAAGALAGVVAKARASKWQAAAEELTWFMKGQRPADSQGRHRAKAGTERATK